MQTNILNEKLEECSCKPMTGFYRDGKCRTGKNDFGSHTICAIMTNQFLQYSKSMGNDLITPRPEYNFLGLKEGDKWCLCASRWKEAHEANCAPHINASATSIYALEIVELEVLEKYFK